MFRNIAHVIFQARDLTWQSGKIPIGHTTKRYAEKFINWIYIIVVREMEITELGYSPGAKMGTWKCLRVQGFMTDPESIGILKEIKLGCHNGNLGELFLFA